ANQVQIKAGPPASNLVSTTSAGSRRMSGQSKVDDKMVAAVANVRAPTRNRAPVTRRRVAPLLSVVTVCRLSTASHNRLKFTLSCVWIAEASDSQAGQREGRNLCRSH